jgi:hypothetical protein
VVWHPGGDPVASCFHGYERMTSHLACKASGLVVGRPSWHSVDCVQLAIWLFLRLFALAGAALLRMRPLKRRCRRLAT